MGKITKQGFVIRWAGHVEEAREGYDAVLEEKAQPKPTTTPGAAPTALRTP
jgi:hypothetical protein